MIQYRGGALYRSDRSGASPPSVEQLLLQLWTFCVRSDRSKREITAPVWASSRHHEDSDGNTTLEWHPFRAHITALRVEGAQRAERSPSMSSEMAPTEPATFFTATH